MKAYERDKKKSDAFMPQVKQMLGELLFVDASAFDDQKQNTDLRYRDVEKTRVQVRVRDADKFFPKYVDEFTVRCNRPTGTKTELAKMLDGFGDYMVYGFHDHQGVLTFARFCETEVFRKWYRDNEGKPRAAIPNHDGSSSFQVFRFAELPPAFVIGWYDELEYYLRVIGSREMQEFGKVRRGPLLRWGGQT